MNPSLYFSVTSPVVEGSNREALVGAWNPTNSNPLQSFWWRMWTNHDGFEIKVLTGRDNRQNKSWTMLESRTIMGNPCCNCGDGSRRGFFINRPFFGLCCHYVILVFVGGIHFLQCLPSAATAISAEALFPSKWLSCQWEIEIFFPLLMCAQTFSFFLH